MATFGHFFVTFGNLWPLLATLDNIWTDNGNLWPFLATFWQFIDVKLHLVVAGITIS